MTTRTASCFCEQLRVDTRGAPLRVSVCHCLDCQRRSGSAFSAQARWPEADVTITGASKAYERPGSDGNSACFHFCPDCGATIAYTITALPGLIGVPIGAFEDPAFPPPQFSVFESRKHGWVEITGDVEHD